MIFLKRFLRSRLFWVGILFSLSSIFRLFFLSLMEFKKDEAIFFFHNYLFLKGIIFPLSGEPLSNGVHNFPFFTYLLAIPSLFFLDPQFLTWIIAFVNIFAIILGYVLFRKIYGNFTAVIASLLLTLSPWSILFSRKIWEPDILLVFSIPFYYFAYRVIYKNDKIAYFGLGLLGTLLGQIHPSALCIVLITIGFMAVAKIKINSKPLLKGIALGIIPSLPYWYYQFFNGTFCKDCSVLGKTHASFDIQNLLRPFELLMAFPFNIELGNDYSLFLHTNSVIQVSIFLSFISIIFFFIGSVTFIKQRQFLWLVYIVSLPICFLILQSPARMHYYIVLFLPIAIVTARGVKQLSINRTYKYFSFLGLFLLLTSYMMFQINFLQFLSKGYIIHGDYGPVFEVMDSIVTTKLSAYKDLPYYQELKYYSYTFAYLPDFDKRVKAFVNSQQ